MPEQGELKARRQLSSRLLLNLVGAIASLASVALKGNINGLVFIFASSF